MDSDATIVKWGIILAIIVVLAASMYSVVLELTKTCSEKCNQTFINYDKSISDKHMLEMCYKSCKEEEK